MNHAIRFTLVLIVFFAISACGGGGSSSGGDSNSGGGVTQPALDTDGDGVPDIDDAFPQDPSESADSDGDGLGDSLEQTIGLNPANGEDAKIDSDNDGFSNGYEAKAGTDWNNYQDKPIVGNWGMFQGNAAHTGFVQAVLNEENFDLHWQQTFVNPILGAATGDGQVFVSTAQFDQEVELSAFSALDGRKNWQSGIGDFRNATAPSFDGGLTALTLIPRGILGSLL